MNIKGIMIIQVKGKRLNKFMYTMQASFLLKRTTLSARYWRKRNKGNGG